MPFCNRVRPDGAIAADPTRGLFMGNRGRLHDADGAIRRQWQTKRWICCVTAFRDRRVPIMAARGYTALFFLDEATALAAGHRPCAECRRQDFNRFVDAWRAAHRTPPGRLYVDALDRVLHDERTASTKPAVPASLPDGAMLADRHGTAWLRWKGRDLRWTPLGYDGSAGQPIPPLVLLTPPATVATLVSGYRPVIHPSATEVS